MLRRGMKVRRMTRKVGQASPQGTIVAMQGDFVEVKWDDGHVSTVSRVSLQPTKSPGQR